MPLRFFLFKLTLHVGYAILYILHVIRIYTKLTRVCIIFPLKIARGAEAVFKWLIKIFGKEFLSP